MKNANLRIIGIHAFLVYTTLPPVLGKYYIFNTGDYEILLHCTSTLGGFKLVSKSDANTGIAVTIQGNLKEATPQEELKLRMEA